MLKNKIGLEIHTTLNTKSKLFCSCKNEPSKTPNVNVCEICLGHPGSKPSPNEAAVKKIIMLGKYLNCTIRDTLVFSRKSYFYPDLSKNYQITQFEEPIATNGHLMIDGTKIRIKRIHLEEDPASIRRSNNKALIDYNRSGTPLAEIVTEPDIKNSQQARTFMKKILTYLKYAKTYDTQKSLIKADVNVSSEKHDYLRAEVKNVTGFKDIQLAIDFEIQRQKTEKVKHQETRMWHAKKQITSLMREKETESDYGYIYEPDIAPIKIPKNILNMKIGKTPKQKQEEYLKLGVDSDNAQIISSDPELASFFDKTIKTSKPKQTAKTLRKDVLQILDYNNMSLQESKFTPNKFSKILRLYETKQINDKTKTILLRKLCVKNINPDKYVDENNLRQIKNKDKIILLAKQAIKENSESVKDYKNGEDKALNYLVGQVMKKSKGKANPQEAKDILKKFLD